MFLNGKMDLCFNSYSTKWKIKEFFKKFKIIICVFGLKIIVFKIQKKEKHTHKKRFSMTDHPLGLIKNNTVYDIWQG